MLEDALRYPLNSDDRVATLLIGGALILLSPLVLPAFVMQGYLLRVLRSAAAGEDAAPSFTDWGGLFVDGLKLLVVGLAYGLVIAVPFVIAAAVVGVGSGLGSAVGGDAAAPAVGIVGILLFLLATLLSILIAYLLPAAMTNFAVEGRMGAAFDVDTVSSAAFSTDYLVGVVLGVVLGGAINAVAGPLVFLLVGLPLLFYGQVVTSYCFARGFAEATAADGAVSGASPDPTRVGAR